MFSYDAEDIPDSLWQALGVSEDRVATWKVSPWAFADKVYLTLSFADPPLLTEVAAGSCHVRINDHATPLVPRVDNRKATAAEWDCPLLFADVTDLLEFDAMNRITVHAPALARCTATVRAAV